MGVSGSSEHSKAIGILFIIERQMAAFLTMGNVPVVRFVTVVTVIFARKY